MPQNEGYYHAAYLAAALIYSLYTLSIGWRRRALRARLADASAPTTRA